MQKLTALLTRFRTLLAALFVAVIIVAAVPTALVYLPGPHAETARVQLPRGASLRAIADRLQAVGAIRNATVFQVYIRLRRQAGALRSGEFDIPARADMPAVAAVLLRGEVVLHPITFAEGLTSRQIVEQMRAEKVLAGEVDVPPEGSLLPETYKVPRGMQRADLLTQMAAAQSRVMADLWPKRQKGLPVTTPKEAVILASIVERETGVAGERPLVAAAFINRLNKKMRLQSDPTIIYGLVGGQGKLGRPIRRSEIRRKTPYNTYRINGLPPTPIANPGREALAAVLNPAKSDVLYFVADGTGGHAFAKTLAEHNRNVRRWRQIEKQQRR